MKVTEEQVKEFNELRMRKGLVPYPKNQMIEMITSIIPFSKNYHKFLTDLKIIEHGRTGKQHWYMFTSTPVHKSKWDEFCRLVKEKNQKVLSNKKNPSIQDAINLLKESGYKIYRKIEKYEEI